MSTVTETSHVVVSPEISLLKDRIGELSVANARLQDELIALRETEAETTNNRLASKIRSQAFALNALNRRVRTQRLVLRKLSELDRNLDVEEWNALKLEHASHFEDDKVLYI